MKSIKLLGTSNPHFLKDHVFVTCEVVYDNDYVARAYMTYANYLLRKFKSENQGKVFGGNLLNEFEALVGRSIESDHYHDGD